MKHLLLAIEWSADPCVCVHVADCVWLQTQYRLHGGDAFPRLVRAQSAGAYFDALLNGVTQLKERSLTLTHRLSLFGIVQQGKKLAFQHEASNHGDVARFAISFQQDVEPHVIKKPTTPESEGDNSGDNPMSSPAPTSVAYTYRVDDLVNRSSKRRKEKTLAEGVPHPDVNVALLLPTTYMNRSGVAVKTFMNAHQWRLKKNALALNRQDELLVVTDDVALPFGTCRFKSKGGPGGQNGIRDIIKCVSTERFARLKIGVGAPHWFVGGNTGAPAGTAMDKFVLGKFNPEEQDAMPDLLEYVDELLRLYLHRGLAQASSIANSMDLATYKKDFQGTKRPSSSSGSNKRLKQ